MQTSYLALFPLLNTKQHIQNHSCCEVCECAVNILQITVRNRRGSTAMLTVVSGHITAYIDHVRDWACPHMSVEGDPGPDLRHGFFGSPHAKRHFSRFSCFAWFTVSSNRHRPCNFGDSGLHLALVTSAVMWPINVITPVVMITALSWNGSARVYPVDLISAELRTQCRVAGYWQ